MRSENSSPSTFETLTVADVMTRNAVVVGPHATLESTQSYFEKVDVNVLPVWIVSV
jgi:CBS-domain-containing membrane protein